jgi:hypothetical protein
MIQWDKLAFLLERRYRSVVLDGTALLLSLFCLLVLAPYFSALTSQAQSDLPAAKTAVGLVCFAVVFLQPLAAVLKRGAAHRRNPNLRGSSALFGKAGFIGLLVYFFLQLMFLIMGSALFDETLRLDYFIPSLFGLLFVGLPLLAIGNTALVRLYFVPPKDTPLNRLLASPAVEFLGEICVFANTLCYLVLWWYLLADPYFSNPPHDIGQFIEKLLALAGMFVFFYLPPRLFTLTDETDSRWVALGMFAANLPILVRAFTGI